MAEVRKQDVHTRLIDGSWTCARELEAQILDENKCHRDGMT